MSTRSTALRVVPGQQLRLDVETFARAANLHPDFVRRLVGLGLLEADVDANGDLWVPVAQLAVAARIQRLRAGFGLNYAALGLVIDLLDRVARLEEALRAHAPEAPSDRGGPERGGSRTWT